MAVSADKFPKPVVLAAQHSERKTGCLACVTLAQWAQESGFGKFISGNHNYFGIKWTKGSRFPYRVCYTKEYVNGKYVTVEAKFVSYPDAEAAFDSHGKLLMNPKGPYRKAIPFAKDWRKFVELIGPTYATDPNYAKRLIELIEKYHLFDWNLPNVS